MPLEEKREAELAVVPVVALFLVHASEVLISWIKAASPCRLKTAHDPDNIALWLEACTFCAVEDRVTLSKIAGPEVVLEGRKEDEKEEACSSCIWLWARKAWLWQEKSRWDDNILIKSASFKI